VNVIDNISGKTKIVDNEDMRHLFGGFHYIGQKRIIPIKLVGILPSIILPNNVIPRITHIDQWEVNSDD
jgi:hypothetical protein